MVTLREVRPTTLAEPLSASGSNHDPGDIYKLHGEVAVGTDTAFWSLHIPENRTYEGWAIFVPGLGGTERSSRPFQRAMVERGWATLRYQPARNGSGHLWDGFGDPQALHLQALLNIAEAVRERGPEIKRRSPSGQQLDVGRITVISQSMGGLPAPKFALKEPGRTEALINLMTVGLGRPTKTDIALIPARLPGAISHELLPGIKNGNIDHSFQHLLDVVRYFGRMRTIFEARSCPQDDVRPDLQRARELGIRAAYLSAQFDILVPNDPAVQEHVDVYRKIKGVGHLGAQVKPGKVADEAIAAYHDTSWAA